METSDTKSPSPEPQPYDPFSYPRLYPSGWNLDGLTAGEAAPLTPEPEEPQSSMPSWYEPFRDLRTFPSGWDLS